MQERLYLQGGSRIEFPSLLSLAGRQDCPSRNCRPRCTTVATSCTAGTHSVTTAILLPILPKRLATAADAGGKRLGCGREVDDYGYWHVWNPRSFENHQAHGNRVSLVASKRLRCRKLERAGKSALFFRPRVRADEMLGE